jgi:hypothetical protein
MATLVPKTKLFLADTMLPAATPDGSSLEEKVNTFLTTIAPTNLLDVQVSLSKSGKYGENFMFAASILYKG